MGEEHKIMKMDSKKREKLFRVAMKEFSNGYKNASTDRIIKEAGISKGLLFHYFNTKEQFFNYLYKYAINELLVDYFKKIDLNERDLLKRYRQLVVLKFEIAKKSQSLFAFVLNCYNDLKTEEANEYIKMIDEIKQNIFANLDTSLFKDNIELEKAINIIVWCFRGYSETKEMDYDSFIANFDKYVIEVDEYLALFRKMLYKEKYL